MSATPGSETSGSGGKATWTPPAGAGEGGDALRTPGFAGGRRADDRVVARPVRGISFLTVLVAALFAAVAAAAAVAIVLRYDPRAMRLIAAQENVATQVQELRSVVGQLAQCGERVCLKTAILADGSVKQTECQWVVTPCLPGSVPVLPSLVAPPAPAAPPAAPVTP